MVEQSENVGPSLYVAILDGGLLLSFSRVNYLR